MEQLSLCTTATEPVRPQPMLLDMGICHNDKPVQSDESDPSFTTTRESPFTSVKTHCNHKYINNFELKKKKKEKEKLASNKM